VRHSESDAERLCQFAGQTHGVASHRHSLIRIAEQPQGQSGVVLGARCRIVAPVAERVRAMLITIVEAKT
jgi:hypothetical protein